jgi:hypothetical protein
MTLHKNTIQCDRCLKLANAKSRKQAKSVFKYRPVRSYDNRNKLKDFCPHCYAVLEMIGKIKNGDEYP